MPRKSTPKEPKKKPENKPENPIWACRFPLELRERISYYRHQEGFEHRIDALIELLENALGDWEERQEMFRKTERKLLREELLKEIREDRQEEE